VRTILIALFEPTYDLIEFGKTLSQSIAGKKMKASHDRDQCYPDFQTVRSPLNTHAPSCFDRSSCPIKLRGILSHLLAWQKRKSV